MEWLTKTDFTIKSQRVILGQSWSVLIGQSWITYVIADVKRQPPWQHALKATRPVLLLPLPPGDRLQDAAATGAAPQQPEAAQLLAGWGARRHICRDEITA